MNRLNAVELDRLIDLLDCAEQADESAWRHPLLTLWEELKGAERVRRWLVIPLLATSVAAPGFICVASWTSWLALSGLLAIFSLWGEQKILERHLPILKREERIEALWTYFMSWRLDEPDEKSAA